MAHHDIMNTERAHHRVIAQPHQYIIVVAELHSDESDGF